MGRWLMLFNTLGALALMAGCGGGGSTPSDSPYPASMNYPAATAAMTLFNEYRAQSLVPPVGLNLKNSLACQAHADYLNDNDISLSVVGLGAHTEDPALPGYTTDGAIAGANSVIYEGVTAEEAIENWMSTFYHRLGLLNPNLKTIGFGSADEYQVMDIISGIDNGANQVTSMVMFPPPGAEDVPVKFKKEIPYPIPGDESLGVPITVEFYGNLISALQVDIARLEDLGSGQVVDCYVQTPTDPFLDDWTYQYVVALLPKDPLPKGHTFRVYVTGQVNHLPWTANWDFST